MQREPIQDGHQRWLAMLTCTVASVALALQYVLLIGSTLDTIGAGHATLRYFSYFTIHSNLLVALATGFALSAGHGRVARFFRRARVRGGIVVYIVVTGMIYVLILRHLWQPQGWQWWADISLHYLTPLLYLLWWITGVPQGTLQRRVVLQWLIYPLLFVVGALLHGWSQGWYPYPFVDVSELGWALVARNMVVMLVAFLAMGAMVLAVDRLLARRVPAG